MFKRILVLFTQMYGFSDIFRGNMNKKSTSSCCIELTTD